MTELQFDFFDENPTTQIVWYRNVKKGLWEMDTTEDDRRNKNRLQELVRTFHGFGQKQKKTTKQPIGQKKSRSSIVKKKKQKRSVVVERPERTNLQTWLLYIPGFSVIVYRADLECGSLNFNEIILVDWFGPDVPKVVQEVGPSPRWRFCKNLILRRLYEKRVKIDSWSAGQTRVWEPMF